MQFQEGFGRYISADGSVWEGKWDSNVREGQGTYTTKDGLIIQGDWTGDEPMG